MNELKLPTLHWIPKLHKTPYKHRFIANSVSCSTKTLSQLMTSCLSVIKHHAKNTSNKIYETSGKNVFWSIKNSGDVLLRLKSLNNKASCISSYDFSTLYTSLPHNLIKEKLSNLIRKTFSRIGTNSIACNKNKAFFTSDNPPKYTIWTCQELIDVLFFLLDNIYVEFNNNVYKQIVGIPMGTNCAPLIADLLLFCYERDFMLSLNSDSESTIIDNFNNTCRYLDDIFNIDNPMFSNYISNIYPPELTLNKANEDDTHASFLDLDLSIINNTISSKIYDKRDDFNFDIVNFPFLDGDVPRNNSYGVFVSQLIRFARACTRVEDFRTRCLSLTAKLLGQGYRYNKLCVFFKKFYRSNHDILSKYTLSLKTLLKTSISLPNYYGDFIYKVRKIKNNPNFNYAFNRLISKFIRKGYDRTILKSTATLVLHPKVVSKFTHLF